MANGIFFMLVKHYVKIAILIKKKPKVGYVNATKWDGGMIFPKDEGVGYWESGEIRIGKSTNSGKTFFEFLGQENTKNDRFSLMQQHFNFPHKLEWTKRFWKTNWGISRESQ